MTKFSELSLASFPSERRHRENRRYGGTPRERTQGHGAALDIKIKQRHPSEFHRKTKVRSIADIDDSRRYWATGISVTWIENNGIDRDNLFL